MAGLESSDQHNVSIYSFDNTTPTRVDGLTKLSLPIPVGFNGIYTQNKEGKPLTAGLSLYSYTGMYPGASVYNSVGNNKFENILTFGPNLAIANFMCGGFGTVKDDRTYYQACSE
ncbi:MAG: hypothetical protein MJ219_01215 [Mycoplasmoidaceae bacterium]|nr:hypothetical protein [Mycoplasmoidaceae bacterium]